MRAMRELFEEIFDLNDLTLDVAMKFYYMIPNQELMRNVYFILLMLSNSTISDFRPSDYLKIHPLATSYLVTSISVPLYMHMNKPDLFNKKRDTALEVLSTYTKSVAQCYRSVSEYSKQISTCGIEGVDDIVMLRTLYILIGILGHGKEKGETRLTIPELFYLSQIFKSIDLTIAAIMQKELWKTEEEIIDSISIGNLEYLNILYNVARSLFIGTTYTSKVLPVSITRVYLPLKVNATILTVRYPAKALDMLRKVVVNNMWWL
jgi:hypothetical protein